MDRIKDEPTEGQTDMRREIVTYMEQFPRSMIWEFIWCVYVLIPYFFDIYSLAPQLLTYLYAILP